MYKRCKDKRNDQSKEKEIKATMREYNDADEELYSRFINEMEQGRVAAAAADGGEVETAVPTPAVATNNGTNGYGRVLHNLLYLDYILMLVTLPMAVYSVMNVSTNLITFEYKASGGGEEREEDIIMKVVRYFNYISVENVDDTNKSNGGWMNTNFIEKIVKSVQDTSTFKDIVRKDEYIDTLGLLGKIHKTIVYYTVPLQIMNYYSIMIKMVTIVIYLLYGFLGSSYMILLNVFFMLCLILTVFRRYKDVLESIIRRFASLSE